MEGPAGDAVRARLQEVQAALQEIRAGLAAAEAAAGKAAALARTSAETSVSVPMSDAVLRFIPPDR